MKNYLILAFYVKEYPCLTRQYIDDNGVEHEIEIKMILAQDNEDKSIYKHVFNDNGTIDLITKININLYEYLSGTTKLLIILMVTV